MEDTIVIFNKRAYASVSTHHPLKLTALLHVKNYSLCLDTLSVFFVLVGVITFSIMVCGIHDNTIIVNYFGRNSGSFYLHFSCFLKKVIQVFVYLLLKSNMHGY